MKKLRVLLVTLIAAVLFGAASAKTMEFWKFGAAEDLANQALLAWVGEWNEANPDSQVELRLFPFGEYSAGTVLTTAFASGSGPDVFWASPGTFLQYAMNGVLADLSSIFTDELRADLLPLAVQAVTVDGIPYAMPFEQEPVALFYNIDLFEKAGLEVPTTWQELLDVSAQFKADGVIPIVVEPAPGPYQNFTWYPFLWQTGADVANEAMTEATFGSDGGAQALDLWGTLINKGYAPRTNPDGTNNVSSTPFATGEAAMQVIGMWAIGVLNNDHPDINYGVTHLPTPTGGDPVTVYGGWTQVVNARSANVEMAKEFTAWMWAQGVERSVEWATVVNSKFSPRQSVTAAAGDYYAEPHLAVFRDVILPTARAEPRFPAEMVRIVGDALQATMFRGTAGADAAASAQRELESFLRTFNK